jgi:hypothetical protein
MPEIPRALPKETIPGVGPNVPMDVGAAGQPWESLHKLGTVINQQAGNAVELAQLYERKKQEAQDNSDLWKVQTEITRDGQAIVNTFEGRTDYGNFPDELAKIQEANASKYQGMVSNPKVLQKIQPVIAHQEGIQAAHVTKVARQRQIDAMQNTLLSDSDFIKDAYATTGDVAFPEEFTARVTDAISHDWLTATQGQMLIKKVAQGGDEKRAKALILTDPDQWFMMDDKVKQFPYMDAERKLELDEFAHNVQERRDRDARKDEIQLHKETANEGLLRILDAQNPPAKRKYTDNIKDWLSDQLKANAIDFGNAHTLMSMADKSTGGEDRKATSSDWVRLYKFARNAKESGVDEREVVNLIGQMPRSMQDNVMSIALSTESKESRDAMILGANILGKTLKEGEADADQWGIKMEEFKQKARGKKPEDIPALAREIAATVEPSPMAAYLKWVTGGRVGPRPSLSKGKTAQPTEGGVVRPPPKF